MSREWKDQLMQGLRELQEQAGLKPGQMLVIGTSTSEIRGARIGKAGTVDTAEILWEAFDAFQKETGVHLAFQCCEHLNRSVLVERSTQETYHLEEVSAVPVPEAGGSMAAYAHRQMKDPVLVDEVSAHAGIDIGDTFIGMHLRRVAVPVRTSVTEIGSAHVTYARTRPKLVGGARAKYE
ncbi:TIGR01440 family protein [Alkalicoccus urumqiensis]|uniref:UPF0340 protein C6I21_07620 n=1 Tax=Alkalicoccus urumqiensis TaxID=1548213 RepID=A0A2P6MHL6_ALKUR|nr:TIGR01440 family protein [Alkalicoccus urumqiensis]PRO65758.1 TIGR01440 family protein [Alkalicoccus urumqiensis]